MAAVWHFFEGMAAVIFCVDTSYDFNTVQVKYASAPQLSLRIVASLSSIRFQMQFCEVFGSAPRFLF